MGDKVVTSGKPFQSKLLPFEAEIKDLKGQGMSLRDIATELGDRHGVPVSHNAVASFLRTHGGLRKSFLDNLTDTRKVEVLKALKAMWTHDSTAIEGNTLSLGDTMIVLEYGLTVKGKPLKDQQDVAAHGCAIDRLREWVGRRKLTVEDIKDLHRLIVPVDLVDIYRPVGDWKREDNGTYGDENGKPVYMAYASAEETPRLMAAWLADFNRSLRRVRDEESALEAYLGAHVSFVRIHPFYDGNGRLARLLANLPVLAAGFPPIVVPAEARAEYIGELWKYQRAVGRISLSNADLLPEPERLASLRARIRTWWQTSLDLVS